MPATVAASSKPIMIKGGIALAMLLSSVVSVTALAAECSQPAAPHPDQQLDAASVGCRRFFGIKGCDPRLSTGSSADVVETSDWDVTVHFSQQMSDKILNAIVLRGSDGTSYRQRDVYAPNDTSDTISFPGPFVEGDTLHLELPSTVVDINGRQLTNLDELKRPIPVAHVPAFLAIPLNRGIVEWQSGTTATLPVIAQNTERSIKVHSWQFDGAVENTPALLALHASFNDSALIARANFINLTHGFSFSNTLLQNLSDATPAMHEQAIDVPAGATQFIGLPLAGYGTWLVEVDSPVYRHTLAAQLKELRRRAPTWANIIVDIDFDGALYLNGANVPDKATLMRQLKALKASVDIQTSAISVHPNKLAPHRLVAEIRKIVKNSGLTIAPAPTYAANNVANAYDLQEIITKFGLPNNETRTAVVQLTNLNIYVQAVKENKVAVWVTALDSGKPVAGAVVELWSAERTLLTAGKTDLHGLATFPPMKTESTPAPRAAWIVVRNGPDVAVSEMQSSVVNTQYLATHTLLDRSAYHVGDTLSMLHLLRAPGIGDWSFAPMDDKFKLSVYNVNDRNTPLFEQILTWRDGSASTNWEIPASVTPGTYVYEITDSDNSALTSGGMFRVEEIQTPSTSAKTSCASASTRYIQGDAMQSSHSWAAATLSLQIDNLKRWAPVVKVQFDPENTATQPEQNVSIEATTDQGEYVAICTLTTDKEGKAHCDIPDEITREGRWTFQARSDHAPTAVLRVDMPLADTSSSHPILQWADNSAPKAGVPVHLRVRSPFVPASMLLTIDHDGTQATHAFEIQDAEQIVEIPTETSYAPGVRVVARFVGDTIKPSTKELDSTQGNVQASLDLAFDNVSHRLSVDVSTQQGAPSAENSTVLAIKVTHAADSKPAAKGKVTVFVVGNAFLLKNPNPTWFVLDRFWKQDNQISLTADGPLAPPSLTTSLAAAKASYAQEDASPALFGSPTERNPRIKLPAPVIVATPVIGDPPPSIVSASQTSLATHPIQSESQPQNAVARADVEHKPITSQAGTPIIALAAGKEPVECSNVTSVAFSKFDIELNERGEAIIPVSLPSMATPWHVVAIAIEGSDHFGTGEALIEALPGSP